MRKLLIENIGLLATPEGAKPLRGGPQGRIVRVRDCAILIEDDAIAAILPMRECRGVDAERMDAGGRLVTPGLVDAHTHMVFGGWRQHELARRLRGESYIDILKSGGGILSSMRETRRAGESELYDKARGFALEMLTRGVTSCEIKSGYGLDIDTELKQLRVARKIGRTLPLDVATTYLGAHAVPEAFEGGAAGYAAFVIDEALPQIAESGLADFCDVFAEPGAFDLALSEAILDRAREYGLGLKLHADELEPMGGGALAARMSATSADHLAAASESSLRALAASETCAVLLPQTSLYLDKPFANARRMIELGIPVALATDFNPGSCPSNNLQLSMNLGLIKYRLTPEEILSAVTLNAACAIGLGGKVGTLEAGKQADLVIWDAMDLEMLCYRVGSNLATHTIKKGRLNPRHEEI